MTSKYRQPTLTARQFIAQGTTAGAIMSIAKGRSHVEDVAYEVASITGQSLKWPGQITSEREQSRRASNDNRRRSNRRAA